MIQANPIAVGHSRLRHYLYTDDPNAQYSFEPIVKEDSWDRFNRGVARKLKIRIASPTTHTANLNNEAETVAGGAANIAEALGAAYITIEVSMGTKRGSLGVNGLRQVLNQFKASNEAQQMDVRLLSTSVKPDGSDPDVIDFLEEYLVFKNTYTLPSNDIDRNYTIRADALKGVHRENIRHIREHYGER